jgi:5-formyltetrahydrofolate cyclo-ligase
MGIPQVSRAETVTCYVSFPTEPGTGPLRRALRQAGIQVLLPVTVPPGDLDWVMDPGPSSNGQDRGGKPPEGAGGLLGRTAIARAQVLIVPALAVDVLGHRLGQGGGYYDRALPLAGPDAPVVALLHTDEFLRPAPGQVPVQGQGQGLVPALPHDRGVDLVAVPNEIIRIERDR